MGRLAWEERQIRYSLRLGLEVPYLEQGDDRSRQLIRRVRISGPKTFEGCSCWPLGSDRSVLAPKALGGFGSVNPGFFPGGFGDVGADDRTVRAARLDENMPGYPAALGWAIRVPRAVEML